MVADVVRIGHFNLIAGNLLLLAKDHIKFLKLQPFFISYVENYAVLEMECTYVKCSVLLIHNTFVDLELVHKFAIISVIVEFDSLHKIIRIIIIILVRLNNWDVPLLGLDDVQCQISQIILIIPRKYKAFDLDRLFDVAEGVFALIIF
jgi:hypothetical protein